MLPLNTVVLGDCLGVMAEWPADSIDAVVCDPPYGLEFMGKAWDKLDPYVRGNPAMHKRNQSPPKPGANGGVAFGTPTRIPRCKKCGKQKFNHPKSRCVCEHPDWDMEGWHHNYGMQQWHEAWAREALRVAKPGAYLLAFGGTRTVHRMTCAIEDAGWIIRDMLVWGYASGFPKGRANLKPAWSRSSWLASRDRCGRWRLTSVVSPLRATTIPTCTVRARSTALRLAEPSMAMGAASRPTCRPRRSITHPVAGPPTSS